ncbi:A disintegrin and metalloproteinase with thrombospondin motifs adt-1-like isoform X1 [Crassostrea angulata]|uniref:A disintegrin and metalloproteinase with thrombospondin motifs adt-1-like isoform X1 n=1 Tax=Magallana angulata TaxID=2784310 RepID=UPI0022B0CBE1|nr:A disintegrin and metalloproteinase with thrombospondin motifs adt-1-like isoform X1 [Crassostrea angulata]
MESSKNTMQIICIIFFARAAFLDAQINNVRLVGGNSPAEGRVEVLYNGEWGTVCDDNFDDKDAAVVCSMLGYSRMNAKSKQQAFFGQGNGRIWMDQLECTDYDSNIFNCSQNILGTHDCGHYEDAGVVCNMFADCGNADILIIMDESGSVGSNHFNTMKTFVRDVIRGLNSVFFRFSVITYNSSPRKIFGFRDFDNLNAIMTSIEHIQYLSGGTRTDRALEYARVSIFNTKRADSAGIVILFTDGMSGNSQNTKDEAALLRNEGVRIFSIGVGSGPNIEELQSIASSPSDEHVFQVSSFSALSHILNAVQTRTCQASVDGGFSEWAMWTPCSRTCGHGLKSRRRTCTNPVPTRNGRNCTGTYSENTVCSIAGCPVDGNWGHWSSWLDCSVTCGTGNQIRRRLCSNPRPENGGRQCQGSSTDTLTCNLGSCPIHGGLSEWNMWSVCSVSCGGGFKTRERACTNPSPLHGGSNCSDYFTDSDICNTFPCPVNGGFGNWGSWSVCSKSCEGGYKVRRRLCNSPTPEYGGKNCIGNGSQNLACNELPCPINGGFTEWSNWTDCSKSCGGGLNIRNRSCTNPSPKYGGKHCKGSLSETLNCNEHQCPIDGGFSLWGAWSSCTVSCGGGTLLRSRSCTNPSPLFGGKNCTGNTEQIIDCNIQLCPIDGKYGDWTTWSQCSNSCGGGSKLRLRRCDNPLPQNGGKQCNGINEDHLHCNTQPCPVDGHFSEWGTWTLCSHSCGGGIKTRFRLCNDPFPAFGGKNCSGSFQQFFQCNPLPCPIDGGLSIWNEWSLCSSTCGGGIQIRNRSCTNPVPQNGGKECEGKTTDSLECNINECPVDGNFSDWGAWTMCSVTCGGGTRMRSRTCTNPSPQFGGKECSDESGQSENCNNISCPVDGGYSEWSVWAECTVPCGGGTSMRERTCTNPSPQHGGKQCEGEANETVECNTNICSICNNPAMEFECHNKVHCIDKDYVCDGLPDCADNSDEIPAVCYGGGQAEMTCPEGLYRCPDGSCKTGPEC